MITYDRTSIDKRLDDVISRLDCAGYRIRYQLMEGRYSVLIYAQVVGEPNANGSPVELTSLKTEEIVRAVFEAIRNTTTYQLGERFFYRGRDLMSHRYRNRSIEDLARLIEHADCEALASGPRTFAVTSRGVATLL